MWTNLNTNNNEHRTYVTIFAVVSCLDMHAAMVAGVHEAVPTLVVQLKQHGHGRVLGPAQ